MAGVPVYFSIQYLYKIQSGALDRLKLEDHQDKKFPGKFLMVHASSFSQLRASFSVLTSLHRRFHTVIALRCLAHILPQEPLVLYVQGRHRRM